MAKRLKRSKQQSFDLVDCFKNMSLITKLEKNLLGGLILNYEAFPKVEQILSSYRFSTNVYQNVFDAMKNCLYKYRTFDYIILDFELGNNTEKYHIENAKQVRNSLIHNIKCATTDSIITSAEKIIALVEIYENANPSQKSR